MEYELEPREYVEALTAAGLTQKQIADVTGIPQPTVSKVLTGRSKDVLSRNYLALKAAYQAMKEGKLTLPIEPAPQEA